MAVWLFRRAGIVLTLFFRISYCGHDLLESLQPNSNDPPELTDFLKSVLHKKDEFKKIREAARYLQLPTSSIEENDFSNNQEDSSNLKHISRGFDDSIFRTSNTRHPLNRRSGNANRPRNDVYPYMYDDNEGNVEPDDREERSSWKDVRAKKHQYYRNQRNGRRYRRGLDLTDYSSDKDSERANIKIFPRSRTGVQIVPGNKYQQLQDASTGFNHRIKQRRRRLFEEVTSKDKTISEILGSSSSTQRAIPEDYAAEHDILGFKEESLSEPVVNARNSELVDGNILPEDVSVSKDTASAVRETEANLGAKESLLGNKNFLQSKTSNINSGRIKRSMKLNIVDNNNLIKGITHDSSAKSVILTLANDKPRQAKEHSQRKAGSSSGSVIDLENLHKALHFGEPYIKIHNNPSDAVDISKAPEVVPEILIQLDKQNEKQDAKQNPNIIKQSDPNEVALIYQVDEDANADKEDNVKPSCQQKKVRLQDVDEPTSALEQYELSTKPYIIVPKYEDIFSTFDIVKGVTEILNPLNIPTNKENHFIVKETNDMVHGKNKNGVDAIHKRTSHIVDKIQDNKNDIEQKSNDYDDAFNSIENKLNVYSQMLGQEDEKSVKRVDDFKNTQNSDYYFQEQHQIDPRIRYQSRKLQSFQESDTNKETDTNDALSQNTRYGYLDYENGRSNHIREPGFTENKIRVKRDLTDLFGMKNDEDYSEDLLNDYNPPVNQERSDYSYEEEGDSAILENQTYDNKKGNENKLQNSKNAVNDFTIVQAVVTTKPPTTCGSSTHLTERSETKDSHLKHNTDNVIKRNIKSNCNSENNYKTSSGSRDDKNCKNCNRKIRSANANERQHFKFDNILYSPQPKNARDSEALNDNYAGDVKHAKNLKSDAISNISRRNCGKNNTFHSKNVSNNTSSEENKKPATEEANSDQPEFKFDNNKNKTNSSCDGEENVNHSQSPIMNPKVKANNEPFRERGPKKDAYSDTESEYDSESGETVEFAHHPLKTKNTPNKNGNREYNKKSKVDVDNALSRFHTKHNQNEFSQNIPMSEHEELPDLETIADKADEANFQKLFKENNNQQSYENLPAPMEAETTNVRNIKSKIKTQTRPVQRNEDENDAEASLQAQSLKNIQVNADTEERQRIEKNSPKYSEEENSSSQVNENKKDIIDPTMTKNTNTLKNTKGNNFLFNSVDNFADIIEEGVPNGKVNKRQAIEEKQWNKQDMLDKIKRLHDGSLYNADTENEYANDAPFEKFSKLNQGYWKKHPTRIRRRASDIPYNKNPSFYEIRYSRHNPPTSNINQDKNYAGRYNTNQRRRLNYMNTNSFRRIRRDQFSKIPETRTGNRAVNDNEKEQQKSKTVITNAIERNPRHKGECVGKHSKQKIKEWNGAKIPKGKGKQCLLSQYSGLNPSFGLKASKGSCNDEAAIEKGSKDYGQLRDALNGNLACVIVSTTFKKVRDHSQLKKRFSHGLVRKHGFKNEMKDLNAFRNNETEGDIKHTEEMLHQIMTVLNKIILDQVRRRTCKHLPPELQKYLASITKQTKNVVDEDSKISEEGFPLPLVKGATHKEKSMDSEQGEFLFNNPEHKSELEADEEEIIKKMKMIQGLLDKYKHMSTHCKIKVEDVEIYLKKHLCLLKTMLKEVKEQQASQKGKACNAPSKLKRKNYDLPPSIEVKPLDLSHYNEFYKTDLINKNLNSLGLGPSGIYKPTFNLDKLIEDTKTKMRFKNLRHTSTRTPKSETHKSQSNYRSEDDRRFEQLDEDYENPRNERKREVIVTDNRGKQLVSDKYRKLVQAAESLRKKRASEERLGKLFGKPGKRSVRNENYETIKSLNRKYQDYSHVGFETPVVFSLKK